MLTDPQALHATAGAVAAAADELAAAGDAAGEANAHLVHALALSRLGKIGASEAALDKALAAARRGNDRRRANTVLANAPLAALWGPSPVTRASGRCLDVVRVLRITQGAPAVEAVALRCQAVLEALRGRGEAARRMIESSRRMVEELGITQGLLETEFFAGVVELIEGNPVAAEHSLRAAYDGLRTHGLGIDAARAASLLGIALLAQDRAAEAEALSHESEALAGDDLQAAITWRRVRAEALARRGEHASAVELARAAVDIAAATDALIHHADARLALAGALRAAGRNDEAAAEQARAIELWKAKGATVLAERAPRAAGRVTPVARGAGTPVAAVPYVKRRVRPNAASAVVARLEAAYRARDLAAIEALCGDRMETVHHPTGATYGREGELESVKRMIRLPNFELRAEVLATLGESLCLDRHRLTASGAAGSSFDVADYEIEGLLICELDGVGRCGRFEVFAPDRMGDAVARLYERYAELLPAGPERERAAATAPSVATLLGPLEGHTDAVSALARNVEYVDHRAIIGLGSTRGAEAFLHDVIGSMLDLAEGVATHTDDIVALRPDALLLRWTTSGIQRSSGGAFERPHLLLTFFGTDGLVARFEQFDVGHEDEALARLDELAAPPSPARPTAAPPRASERAVRRVRPNAATASEALMEAAIAKRDIDAIASHYAEDYEVVDHRMQASYDRQGSLVTWRGLIRSPDGAYRSEPLASLGDSLALFHYWVSASRSAGKKFDVGASSLESMGVAEVDAQGRRRRTEVFAVDHLGDAVVRLYERYAELLPDDSARPRAAATARSVAALPLVGALDLDRYFAALSPELEFADHRLASIGSVHGAAAHMNWVRSLFEVADDIATHADDILALRADALLVRWINTGTLRAGGGTFERHFLLLWVFGADGRVARVEQFDLEAEDRALARFDELAAEPRAARRRVRPNAATASEALLEAAVAGRDLDAIAAHLAEDLEVVDHRMHVSYDRQGSLITLRGLIRSPDAAYRSEPLASLGDSLALCHYRMSASEAAGKKFDIGDFGAYEIENIILVEVDGQARRRRTEVFARDRLGDAVARLYERYAEPLRDGPMGAHAAAIARSVAASLWPFDLDRLAEAYAPAVEFVDHRTLGTWSAHGAEELMRHWRALFDLADDLAVRDDDILALQPHALLISRIFCWTDRASGGIGEVAVLALAAFGADGRLTRIEAFDPDLATEALARFDELTAEPRAARPAQRRVRANAATAMTARVDAAIVAGDAEALPDLFADDFGAENHITHTPWDRGNWLSSCRSLLLARNPTCRNEPLATLGDSLALCRASVSAGGLARGSLDVGAYENVYINLVEVDAKGRWQRGEVFAADHLGDAVARLYERYAELLPAGPERDRAAATARSVAALPGPIDLDRIVRAFAPAVQVIDHRTLGTWSAHGVEEMLQHWRAWTELADGDTRVDDILGLRADAFLCRTSFCGRDRAGGGTWEVQNIQLCMFGVDGRLTRAEVFDPDREADALARFDELTTQQVPARPARRVRPNAATATAACVEAAAAARDAGALSALYADEYEVADHTTGITYDRQGELTSLRALMKAEDARLRGEPLATLGDALVLARVSAYAKGLAGRNFDFGPYQMETVHLIEVDAQGRCRRTERFATDHLGDAIVRLYERYAELLPDGPARVRVTGIARSVALTLQPFDLDRYAETLEPTIELVDHRTLGTWSSRGAEDFLRHMRAMFDLAEDAAVRYDDVLALQSDAFLVSPIFFGTDRAGGGVYEIANLALCVFGADGRRARIEWFDRDQAADALARFDELTAEPPAARPARRVRANAATAMAARLDAAIATRDAEALPDLFADDLGGEDHITHTPWDRQSMRSSFRSLLLARDPTSRHEPLATLGDSLALCRMSVGAAGLARGSLDVGAYEKTETHLIEVDAQGRRRWTEAFATDHLSDAVVRLYQRYAELLPEGPEHARAEATTRTVAALPGHIELDRVTLLFAPAVQVIDHRTLGTWSARGVEEWLRHWRAMLDLSADVALRFDDILGLRTDALLCTVTTFGTDRAGGGALEYQNLVLLTFGVDGQVTRVETFDLDHDTEALARFDELTAEPSARRRVKPNAATAMAARLDAAIAAGDAEALPDLFAEEFGAEDHITHTPWDQGNMLTSFRSLLLASDPTCWNEPLATLGDSLALCRVSMSAGGLARGSFDVGAYEKLQINLVEVDAKGRWQRGEAFAADRLGDAVARLYERYAELVPDPLERNRIASVARAVTAQVGLLDFDRVAATMAPGVESVDHRILGTWSAHGAEAVRQHLRAFFDLSDNIAVRDDDVLALRADAFLVRRTVFAADRAGGGAFERLHLELWVFGADGLVTRWERFDVGHEAEALARFDELGALGTGAPATAPRAARIENAATRAADRYVEAWHALDIERFAALHAPGFRNVDRRQIMSTDLDRDQFLASFAFVFARLASATVASELLATRGDRLALFRMSVVGTEPGTGPIEVAFLQIFEMDALGRIAAGVGFDPDDLDAAYAELDDRYLAAESVPSAHNWVNVVSHNLRAAAAGGWDQLASLFSPDLVMEDHRPVGVLRLRSRDEWVASVRSLLDLRSDARLRVDHVLGIIERGSLAVVRWEGGEPEGTFEIPIVVVTQYGSDGKTQRCDLYNLDQLDAARACYNELAVKVSPPRIENSATRGLDRFADAWAAHDWERIASRFAPGLRVSDRRSYAHLDLDRDQHLASLRFRFEMSSSRATHEVLATRGHRLVLERSRFELADRDVGPSETESLALSEVDEHDDCVAVVMFDPHDLDAAYAELDDRYLAGEGAPHARIFFWLRFTRAAAARDWEQLDAVFAPDLVIEDHRPVGALTLRSRDEYVASLRALLDLRSDASLRCDHVLALDDRRSLMVLRWEGGESEGTFEIPMVVVTQYGSDGIVQRCDLYDLDQLDAARACYNELAVKVPPPRIENAATRVLERFADAWAARDWERVTALSAPGFRSIDRRSYARLELDRDQHLASLRFRFEMCSSRWTAEVLATRGQRLALARTRFELADGDVGPSESAALLVLETDEHGAVEQVTFDPDDLAAGYAELDRSYAAGEAAPYARAWETLQRFDRAAAARDWEQWATVFVPGYVVEDHRRLGWGTLHSRDEYMAYIRALVDLAPDVTVRLDHVLALDDRGTFVICRSVGSREGGPFEIPFVAVIAHGPDGLIHRSDLYDFDQLDEARARFEAIGDGGQAEDASPDWRESGRRG